MATNETTRPDQAIFGLGDQQTRLARETAAKLSTDELRILLNESVTQQSIQFGRMASLALLISERAGDQGDIPIESLAWAVKATCDEADGVLRNFAGYSAELVNRSGPGHV